MNCIKLYTTLKVKYFFNAIRQTYIFLCVQVHNNQYAKYSQSIMCFPTSKLMQLPVAYKNVSV